MEQHTYTRTIQSIVDKINNENFSDEFTHDLGGNDNSETMEELKKLLKEYNRSFSEGLTLLLEESSYNGDPEDLEEKKKYVKLKLKSIGASEDEKTIFNWLTDKQPRVDEPTRDRIYRLCFALSVSIDVVDWFFNHVYFQRSFNCHRMEEAVYYYCFKNSYDYEHAKQLISEIQSFPKQSSPHPETIVYTTEIQQQLDLCSTDEDLKQYFRENRWTFQENQANQRAEETLRELLENIQGKKSDRAIAEKVQNGTIKYYKDLPEITNCGLIVQEILSYDEPHKSDFSKKYDTNSLLNYLLSDNDISSTKVMLKCIYGRLDSKNDIQIKKINLPEYRRKNFPSEKTFSDLLNKGLCTPKKYDAIRKCLILLTFYQFWCEVNLSKKVIDIEDDNEYYKKYYENYLAVTNRYLTKCGYDALYSGNNYDRLFMLCSGSAAPLDTLRNFLSSTV